MARITTSDAAPSGDIRFAFAFDSFSFDSKTTAYVTDDPVTIAEAQAHPWLQVEDDAALAVDPYIEPAPATDDEETAF